jgi:putative DNA methylase
MPPVNPESRRKRDISSWRGAQGLAEDVGYYGKWMREEAEKRIGHLYPKVKITPEMVAERSDLKPYEGKELTVIAWIWARTVKSPNPAFSKVNVPLTSTFMLATKPGKEAYVDPVIEGEGYRFSVRAGRPKDMKLIRNGTKLSRGANFQCLMSTTPISGEYIKSEGASGRMGARLMAIVAEGNRERVYLSPTADMESTATAVLPSWKPETPLPEDMRSHWTPPYGLRTYGDLFTARQLVALTTLSDLAQEAREKSQEDALAGGFTKEERPLSDGGAGALAYGEAVGIYLAFVVEKLSESHSSICTWSSAPKNELVVSTFRRQGLPMTWDYAESNPFAESSGSIGKITEAVARVLILALPANVPGQCSQQDASSQALSSGRLVSTDPPYYDNIGYADLSDFFYVWMRRTLKHVFPKLFATLAVPKIEELVAAPYRHGGSEKAEVFFLKGMTLAMHRIAEQSHPAFPVTIYYAFKQSESKNDLISNKPPQT